MGELAPRLEDASLIASLQLSDGRPIDVPLAGVERLVPANAYGVFDMVGNLHEWIDDPEGTFRGGFYMDTSRNGDGCSYETTAHNVQYHDYSTGFRCCMEPERVE